MRRLWCAGAIIAGGFFLVTASPAQADRVDVDNSRVTGLMPNGPTRDLTDRPTRRQAAMFGGGIPLLGGLGGRLPANEVPRTPPATDGPDLSGMPAGGLVVPPAATDGTPSPAAPTSSTPAQPTKPAKTAQPTKTAKPSKPRPVVTPDDPRLYEEPAPAVTEPVAEEPVVEAPAEDPVENRPFSAGGRPVAGIDEQYR